MSMTTTISDARRDLADLYNRVAYGGERVIIERHGKVRVALVPAEDLELLEAIEDKLDLRAALEARKEAEEQGTVSAAQLKRELVGSEEFTAALKRFADSAGEDDPEVARQMALAEEGMSRYRHTLRALAK